MILRDDSLCFCSPHKYLYGDTLGLPASYARFLYLTGLLSHTLLGLGAWQVLRHGGLMQNLNQYGTFLLLLAVAPFCRLHSSPSRRWKRNLLPEIAGKIHYQQFMFARGHVLPCFSPALSSLRFDSLLVLLLSLIQAFQQEVEQIYDYHDMVRKVFRDIQSYNYWHVQEREVLELGLTQSTISSYILTNALRRHNTSSV